MTGVVLCICQAAAVAAISVHGSGDPSQLAVTTVRGVPHVRIAEVVSQLGGATRQLPNGRLVLELHGQQFELAHAVPYVRVSERVIPLLGAPVLVGLSPSVPLQLIADVLPRLAADVKFDSKGRRLSTVAEARVAGVTPPVATAASAGRGGVPPVRAAGQEPARGSSQPPPVVTAGASTNSTSSTTSATSRTPSGSAAAPQAAPAAARTPPPSPPRRRIVIDAGHGGVDEGTSVVTANGTRITEKSITLSVSNMLGEELKKRGFDVTYTRTKDTLIALQDRGRIANEQHGSAFISVHVNAAASGSGSRGARGVETYFLSVARTEDARRLAALENSSVRFEQRPAERVERDPLSFILNDMQQNDHLRESSELATRIQGSLSKVHPGGDRGVKQAEFAVLVGAFMPAVLVEIGFLSNESDAAFLQKRENQQKLASSIAVAIEAHFKDRDKRVVADGVNK